MTRLLWRAHDPGAVTPPGSRFCTPTDPATRNDTALQGEEELGRVYDSILEARFDQVDAELQARVRPGPGEACDVLAATALWWRILLDPDSRALDDEFSTRGRARHSHQRRVDRARRRTTQRPGSTWAAPTPRGCSGACCVTPSWQPHATASASSRRSNAPSSSAPDLDDAYFGIGMYQVLRRRRAGGSEVSAVPAAAARWRSRSGPRADAPRAQPRAALQGEADYQLHVIYLWYEESTDRALELLRDLEKEYPANPLFLSSIAEIQDTYLHDITASLAPGGRCWTWPAIGA